MSYREDDPPAYEADGFPDECVLALSAQRGDQLAFATLYERYINRINRYITRLVGNDSVGCELAQEVFLKAWKALPDLRNPERFASWLYRIATNTAYNYQNHARLIRMVSWEEYNEKTGPLSAPGPESLVEEREMLQLILARVSPTYRPCFILYVIEKVPPQQIADLLGIKVSSVGKYVSRGREEFRQIYYRMVNEKQRGS